MIKLSVVICRSARITWVLSSPTSDTGLPSRRRRLLGPIPGPNRVGRALNRAWALVGRAGLWPNRLVTLEVRRRRSGRMISFPLVVADVDGERYLVAMLGERASWVQNVRAGNGRVILRPGRRETVRLEQVDPGERPPILRRYVKLRLEAGR
jgi:hypothetical protein